MEADQDQIEAQKAIENQIKNQIKEQRAMEQFRNVFNVYWTHSVTRRDFKYS